MNNLLVKASNIKSITPLDMHGRQRLSDIGIDSSVVPHTVKSIHLLLLNKVYNGIGTENENGGLEFFSSTLLMDLSSLKETCNTVAAAKEYKELERSIKVLRRPERKTAKKKLTQHEDSSQCSHATLNKYQTVTLNHPGINYFPVQRKQKSDSCCIFAGMIDYLSYLTILKDYPEVNLPTGADCIVVNSVSNFVNGLLDCENYNKIYCMLPNTEVGAIMACTIRDRNKSKCRDSSKVYADYIDLQQYLSSLKQTSFVETL